MLFLILSLLLFLSISSGLYFVWATFVPYYHRSRSRAVAQTLSSLDEQFLFLTPRQVDLFYLISMAVATIAGGIFFSSIQWPWYGLVLILSALAGSPAPRWVIGEFSRRRSAQIEKQIPDFLKMMSGSLRAGLSLSESLKQAVQELPAPISQELGLVLKKNKMGETFEESLRFLDKRLNLEEMSLVVSAIILSNEAGGSLAPLFDRLENTLAERKRIKGKIDALTAQGKLQGWVVGLLPLLLGLILFSIDPTLMTPFWTTSAGVAGLISIVLLELAGFWMIRRIIAEGEI
jgi:tight adherence protein B